MADANARDDVTRLKLLPGVSIVSCSVVIFLMNGVTSTTVPTSCMASI
jgi:hypothetical protein